MSVEFLADYARACAVCGCDKFYILHDRSIVCSQCEEDVDLRWREIPANDESD